jgi:D-hydroxyproline dehydrogenase subunit beta
MSSTYSTRPDRLILDYLSTFLQLPDPRIAERWHGTYAKHPDHAYFAATLEPNVRVVTGLGGAGMTLSFGVAEKTWADWL